MGKGFTLAQLKKEAERFTKELQPTDEARVIALQGDLGSGKTTFVQAMAHTLGVKEHVTSPTFIIQKIYELENQQFQRLVHIDAYRLEGAQELEKLGWHELVKDPKNLIVIEWPEHVAGLVPSYAQHIHFTYMDESSRHISYDTKS